MHVSRNHSIHSIIPEVCDCLVTMIDHPNTIPVHCPKYGHLGRQLAVSTVILPHLWVMQLTKSVVLPLLLKQARNCLASSTLSGSLEKPIDGCWITGKCIRCHNCLNFAGSNVKIAMAWLMPIFYKVPPPRFYIGMLSQPLKTWNSTKASDLPLTLAITCAEYYKNTVYFPLETLSTFLKEHFQTKENRWLLEEQLHQYLLGGNELFSITSLRWRIVQLPASWFLSSWALR